VNLAYAVCMLISNFSATRTLLRAHGQRQYAQVESFLTNPVEVIVQLGQNFLAF